MSRRLALTVMAVAMVAACGGNTTEPGPQGSFQASVTGDLTLSLSGEAVFGTQEGSGFIIAMEQGNVGGSNADLVMIGRDSPDRPAPGTYEIVSGTTCEDCTSEDFSGLYLHQITALDLGFYVSLTGSFTIDTSTDDRVTGSFSFTATGFILAGDVTAEDVALEGTFSAVPGTIPSPI
jgi:hypothetical protein